MDKLKQAFYWGYGGVPPIIGTGWTVYLFYIFWSLIKDAL